MTDHILDASGWRVEHNPTMKADTVRGLSASAEGRALLKLSSHAVLMLACDSGFGSLEPFPLNARGVPWVESYLRKSVWPSVKVWGMHAEVVELKDPADRDQFEFRLWIATVVFSFCICNEVSGCQWAQLEPDFLPRIIVPEFGHLDPHGKVRRFAHFGEEDSLVGMVAFIVNAKSNREQYEAVQPHIVKKAAERGIVFKGYRLYNDEVGKLNAIALLDEDFTEVALFELRDLTGLGSSIAAADINCPISVEQALPEGEKPWP